MLGECMGRARLRTRGALGHRHEIDRHLEQKLFPLGSTYFPPRLAVRGLVRRGATSKRRRGVLPPRLTKRTPNLLSTFTRRNRGRILIAAAISAFGAHTHRTLRASNRASLMRLTLWPCAAVCTVPSHGSLHCCTAPRLIALSDFFNTSPSAEMTPLLRTPLAHGGAAPSGGRRRRRREDGRYSSPGLGACTCPCPCPCPCERPHIAHR